MIDIDIPAAMDKAAEIIETPGKFGKGRFKRGECYCTLGAFAVAVGMSIGDDGFMDYPHGRMVIFNEGWEHLNETVKAIEGNPWRVVQAMNDHPGTTADQMAGVLRQTAARLRAEA